MLFEEGDICTRTGTKMEWNNAYKSMKDFETKTMMDMALIPTVDSAEFGLGSSEKGNASPVSKPRKKSMTSIYLKYFETAPDGKSRRCKFCKQSYSIATATGNLGRHLSHRHPGYDKQGDIGQQVLQHVATTKKPQTPLKCTTLDFDHLNWLLLKWLVEASLPPSITEDAGLLDSFKFLNSTVKLWPRDRVQAVAMEVFRCMREDVKASLERVNSKVSITLDFWTSCEQVFYMSVKGHWIDENWSFHKVLLDVSRISFPCEGPDIFHALKKVLKMFNIDKKILSCTNDNSQPSIIACHALKEELDARKVPFFYLPCAARTLNLIIEEGLRSLKSPPQPILPKIREFALELNASSEIAHEFRQLTANYQEGSFKFPLDTSARWTGDYTMLEIAGKAPISMEATIRKYEETFGRSVLLNIKEKSAVNTLHSYLETFYKTTTNLCTCKVPTIGLVLFFMDNVFEEISGCRDSCPPEWLKSAADNMAKIARNFSSLVYSLFTYMAAILDPRIKKELIPENLNSEINLEEARKNFARYYSISSHFPAAIANGGYGAAQQQSEEVSSSVSFAEEIARKRRRVSMGATADELTQYLLEPPAHIATDVLDWWKVNSTRYPRLSVMARDYLAIQGTSVEPDELFSSKGDEIQKQQFFLSGSAMQAMMCIRSWFQSGYKFKFRSTEIDFHKLMESAAAATDSASTIVKQK